MRILLIVTLLGVIVPSATLDAQNFEKVPLIPYRSNGFFLSYFADQFFGIGELQARQHSYRCTVTDLTCGVNLCDTTWVLEWWEAEDTTDLDIPAIIGDFEDIPGITITPNYFYRFETSPDVPCIESQSPYVMPNDSLFPLQWHLQQEHLDMPSAWGMTIGSPLVTIGILDTGVWFDHEDLRDNLWINPGEDLNGDGIIQEGEVNGVDDDGNGYPDDFCGWDWMDDDNDARHSSDDVEYHGTKVAGVASATSNNCIGIAGIGWSCLYVPLKAGSCQGLYLEHIVPAMLYAITMGIDVLNCSWYNYYDNPVLSTLTRCLYDEGTVVVACVGNNDMNRLSYPAAYDWVVGVAATDENRDLTSFTNFGDWIHLAAPGVSILTTTLYGDSAGYHSIYSYKDGTSFSAPMVSAAAALVKSLRPNWNPSQIFHRLYTTSEPLADQDNPPGRSIDGGILNVSLAVDIPDIEIDPFVPGEDQ